MKVQIICGFLGAGKTTMLKNILKQQNSDTAVLVNEFGEMGIDGTIISDGNNLNVIEMPSGCICCTLRDSLVDSVKEIMNRFNPRQLIIEPSGIASPSSIILGLKGSSFYNEIELAPVIGIIDLTFFIEMVKDGDMEDLGDFFKDQILNSDITMLNKADLVTADEIRKCREAVLTINPETLVIPTVYCQTEIPEVEGRAETVHFHGSPHFHAESFLIPGKIDQNKLVAVLAGLAGNEHGKVFRAKGIINTFCGPRTFDYVHGSFNFGEIGQASENKFVFIGRHVDRAGLENAIRGCVADGSGS